MSVQHQQPYVLFKSYFRIRCLKEIYNDKFKSSTTKGIDRLNGVLFEKQSNVQIKLIHNKCLSGKYKFSPYLELLQSKGRGKNPRVLAIPSIRDRIVLDALKNTLFSIFPECVSRKLANTHIYEIKKFIDTNIPSSFGIFRTDIKNFYDSIDREKLFEKLKIRIKSQRLLKLIKKAIESPIVPKNYNRKEINKYMSDKGVPQGLSISNILAYIYLYDFDNCLKDNSCIRVYHRYVDDILVLTDQDKINEVKSIISDKMDFLKLELNEDKTYTKLGYEEFEYLGYRFQLPLITIRSSTIEKFIHSIASKFSSYIHNRKKRLQYLKKNKYGIDKLKEVFLIELNEKITGAINGKQRYGWIFYFNAINDVSILYKIDSIIANLFKRLEDFGKQAPSNLKKLSRAFYEAKYRPDSNYIHNYNQYETVEQKKSFLLVRGRIKADKIYSDKNIISLYEKIKNKNLSDLDKDDALMY